MDKFKSPLPLVLVCRGSQMKWQDPEIYDCYDDETSSASHSRKRMQSLKHVWSWCIYFVETNRTLNTISLNTHSWEQRIKRSFVSRSRFYIWELEFLWRFFKIHFVKKMAPNKSILQVFIVCRWRFVIFAFPES